MNDIIDRAVREALRRKQIVTEKIRAAIRNQINRGNRKKLNNKEPSLLSSNCNGAFLLHDLGLEFRTPTVNLWMKPKDYIELLKHLEAYLKEPLQFDDRLEQQYGYPVGVLKDTVKIYFQHYKTRQEAQEKWEKRSARVDLQNLFIWFTDRDGCTYEDLKEFDALPYKNKVAFTHVSYPEFKSAFYIEGFEKEKEVGLIFDFKKDKFAVKYYDDFPYVEWFNGALEKS